MQLPKAILLDLDDTILNDSGSVHACWEAACMECASECEVDLDALMKALRKSGGWFWSDPERHRIGRLDLRVARIEVARLALAGLGIENPRLGEKLGSAYHDRRNESIEVFPEAIDTVKWFREQGCKLAMLTNGNGAPQRKKIEKFGIQHLFDAIFIEGELGFGKPDERVYRLALETLGVDARDAWMAGDNLKWDVTQPQKLGIFSIWIDASGTGHARLESSRPDRIVRSLSELKI